MNAIETDGLSKSFKAKVAVKNLNLTVAQGELFSLLGVNGAGKTTTIKMLCCLLAPTAGDARILGHSVRRESAAVKQSINLSPQETAIARNLSARENLEFIAGLYGSPRQEARRQAQEMLESFGLAEAAKDKAKTLSGGMQRRLSVAMALITRPQVLFLDEPTLGLDVLARRELWAAIRKLKGQVTVVLTTHYMEEAEALSDRIGVMAKGELRAVGTLAQLTGQTGAKSLEDAFVALATEGGGAA